MTDSYAEYVGQSLMLSFTGPRLTPEVAEVLARTRAGGVILFAENIGTPAELYDLCAALQAQAETLGLPPLLIAIDQEGGIVSRLPAPFTVTPSQMAQAVGGDPAPAHDCASITGAQLRAFGINTNFAPVLDVNCNPANPVIGTRSFGADPDTVTRFGLAALAGYQEAGVIATIKHFPGHGDTSIDSHFGLPVLRHNRARLDEIELAPFKAAIAAGAPALMTAHIVFSALDALPATLSRPVLTGLLRDELGFDGVIFTDALCMQAIADNYSPAEAAILAKAAGADVILPLGSLENQVAVAEALAGAIQAGRLAPELFSATTQRLDALRTGYGLTHTLLPFTLPDPALQAQARAIARHGIAVRDEQSLLPLAVDTRLALIDCLLPRFSAVEEASERAGMLRDLVQRAFPEAMGIALAPKWDAATEAQALELARSSAAILLITRNARFIEQQAHLARLLAQLNIPLIHAAVRNPDAAAITPDGALVQTYGDPPLSLEALVEVVSGNRSV